jgi:hypothetical protein
MCGPVNGYMTTPPFGLKTWPAYQSPGRRGHGRGAVDHARHPPGRDAGRHCADRQALPRHGDDHHNHAVAGQIAEAWGNIDLLGLMLQLGLVTPPGQTSR